MTENDKALVAWLHNEAVFAYDKEDTNILNEIAARIEALSAENELLREALRSAIRNIENLTYDIKSHTECDECQQNVAMYEGVVKEYRAPLGDTK